MLRKKISADGNAAAVIDLDDDEQLEKTVTTKTTIGKSKKTADKSKDDEVIEALPVLDADEADEAEQMQFSETSLAGLLTNDDEDDFANQFCTINVRREPDALNDRFLTPCSTRTNLRPLRNVELTAEVADIEDRVLELVGGSGGHYFFQIQYNGRLAKSWKSTLADDPAAVARSKAEANPQPAAVATQPVDAVDSFLNNLRKQKEMRDLLFGDAEKKFEESLAELRAENERLRSNPAEPKSENLLLLEMARDEKNEEHRQRLLDRVFGGGNGERHWLADAMQVALENKDAILGVIGSLIGGATPAQNAETQTASGASVDDLLRSQPPAEFQGFQRKALDEKPAAEIDVEPVADNKIEKTKEASNGE